jgi:OOP family OmpA-OmpF porin
VNSNGELEQNTNLIKNSKGNDTKWMRQIPVYALGKFNLVTTKKGNDVLYVLGRAGIALNESKVDGLKYDNGLYVAGGLGTEMGPVSLEAIYERAATPFTNASGLKQMIIKNHSD